VQQQSPTPVSPGLDRPGLTFVSVLQPALHLIESVWVASCPTCGYQLTTARTQPGVERRAARRRCPVCREDT
jgi:hypothetical protein